MGAHNSGEDRFKLIPEIEYVVNTEYDIPIINGELGHVIYTKTEKFSIQSNNTFINVVADINKRLFSSEVVFNSKVKKDKLDTSLFF